MKLLNIIQSYLHWTSLYIISMFFLAFHCDKSVEPEIKSSKVDRVISEDDKFLGDNVPENLKKSDPESDTENDIREGDDLDNYEMPTIENSTPSTQKE